MSALATADGAPVRVTDCHVHVHPWREMRPDIVALMRKHSEDPGSAYSGKAYTVEHDSPMVEPFKNLSLRLGVGEAGLVKSRYR